MSEASKENGNEPAAAFVWEDRDRMVTTSWGMTKRELIAMHMMVACITAKGSPAPDWERCADDAKIAADALLEALE